MPLHWFPTTPLFFHPSVPNIYNITGTNLLLKVLHTCHVLHHCLCYIIYIVTSWLPQFHSAQCQFSLWEWDHHGRPNYQLLDSCLVTVAISATTFLLLVQLSSSLAHKPPHQVQTCHPILTKYHLMTYHTAIITVSMSHSTEGNCHRKCGWYNLYIIGHKALNCLQTLLGIMPGTA